MNIPSAIFECRYPGHAGTVLLHIYDPDAIFEKDEFEKEILKHCLTLVGPRSKVYWFQNEMPNLKKMVRGRTHNPMIYKKVELYATLSDDFVEGLTVSSRILKESFYQLAGFVVNLRSWTDIGPEDITGVLQAMRYISAFFRKKFQDEERQNRILLHLPGTHFVLTAIARENATIVRL